MSITFRKEKCFGRRGLQPENWSSPYFWIYSHGKSYHIRNWISKWVYSTCKLKAGIWYRKLTIRKWYFTAKLFFNRVAAFVTSVLTLSLPESLIVHLCCIFHVTVAHLTSSSQVKRCPDNFSFKAGKIDVNLCEPNPDSVGDRQKFPNRYLAAVFEACVSCAVGRCHGGEFRGR
jgi:hypothetical protein